MAKTLHTKDLLYELRDYIQAEIDAWEETGTPHQPSILKSLLEEIEEELRIGMCDKCGGPMVLHSPFDVPFCGSWLYMEGGCAPAPIIGKDRYRSK